MLTFIIWALGGILFVGLGIFVSFSQTAPWANFDVKDITSYNRELGILSIICGIVFLLLGLPLFAGQNSPYIIISILGGMVEAIVAMSFYFLVIEPKYRNK